jgi:hypothetical protein
MPQAIVETQEQKSKRFAEEMADLIRRGHQEGVPLMEALNSTALTILAISGMPVTSLFDGIIKVVLDEGRWPKSLQEFTLDQQDEQNPETWRLVRADEKLQN